MRNSSSPSQFRLFVLISTHLSLVWTEITGVDNDGVIFCELTTVCLTYSASLTVINLINQLKSICVITTVVSYTRLRAAFRKVALQKTCVLGVNLSSSVS